MPLYAVLSDIHSNLHALEAVLKDCAEAGVTSYFCLGDIVGYGPQPAQCLQRIRELGCAAVMGNHEHLVGASRLPLAMNPLARAGIRYSQKQLSGEEKEWIAGLPQVVRAPKSTMVHSSLNEPEEWHYIFDAADAQLTMERQKTSVCFYGHTHVPALFSLASGSQPKNVSELKFYLPPQGRYLINCGSVGQPRNHDPRAQYVLFDPLRRQVSFRRVKYDAEKTARLIYKVGLPKALGDRLLVGM